MKAPPPPFPFCPGPRHSHSPPRPPGFLPALGPGRGGLLLCDLSEKRVDTENTWEGGPCCVLGISLNLGHTGWGLGCRDADRGASGPGTSVHCCVPCAARDGQLLGLGLWSRQGSLCRGSSRWWVHNPRRSFCGLGLMVWVWGRWLTGAFGRDGSQPWCRGHSAEGLGVL